MMTNNAYTTAVWLTRLDNPAPLQDLKPAGVSGALHDHQCPLQHCRHPRDELARVPPVSPDQPQAREAGGQCRQDLFCAFAVLDARRVHHHHEEQPQNIDHDVALAPADALAAVIPPGPLFQWSSPSDYQ
jgi:hypothetical protein